MEKLVSNLKKKFLANPSINLVEMNIPEGNGIETPDIFSIIGEAEHKYIIKTSPIIKRIYDESVRLSSSKVAFKVRKDMCNTCESIKQMEVVNEVGFLWTCVCLTCGNTSNIEIILKDSDSEQDEDKINE